MTIQLNSLQQQVLNHAALYTVGKLIWFPDGLKSYTKNKIINTLFRYDLISTDGDDWFVTANGYELIEALAHTCIKLEAIRETTRPRPHANSRQAQMINLLKRPEGATMYQLCDVTGWTSHTIRSVFYSVIKKRLKMPLTSAKPTGKSRIYRIPASS